MNIKNVNIKIEQKEREEREREREREGIEYASGDVRCLLLR